MIDKIKKHHLCMGCGLCASVLGTEKCEMRLNEEGFYEPNVIQPLSSSESRQVKKLCLGIRVVAKAHKGVWGSMLSICEGWAADAAIRHKAASGGVVTSLAIWRQALSANVKVGFRNMKGTYKRMKKLNGK